MSRDGQGSGTGFSGAGGTHLDEEGRERGGPEGDVGKRPSARPGIGSTL